MFEVSMDCLTRSSNLLPLQWKLSNYLWNTAKSISWMSTLVLESPPLNADGFSTSNSGKIFCKWLRSYNPVAWMKSYFQTTDRHVILSILSKTISPDFLNCVSKNQKGKKRKRKEAGVGGKPTSNAAGISIQGSRLLAKPRRKWSWLQVMHSSVTTKCHCNQSESL